jgi:hypothetical protein
MSSVCDSRSLSNESNHMHNLCRKWGTRANWYRICGANNDWVRLHEVAFNFRLTPVKLFGPIHNKGRENEEAKRFLAD